MLKNTARFTLAALFIGWLFDFFFWGQGAPVLTVSLFVLSLAAIGLTLAALEGIQPARSSLLLLVPIGYFAVMYSVRSEPFSRAMSLLAALALLMLFARTFRGGKWMEYGLLDYVVGMFEVGLLAVFGGLTYALDKKKSETANNASPAASPAPVSEIAAAQEAAAPATAPAAAPRQSWLRRALPILRGLLLALPILAVFASLLAQADPVFNRWLEDVLAWFDIENLEEYIARLVTICIIAWLAAGVLLNALLKSQNEALVNSGKPFFGRLLGITESSIVLGSVELLFLVFVFIQFRYFFGGQANITLEGYTYAEYARRGFNEMVVVVVFSLLLFIGLSSITRRSEAREQKIFAGLGVGLVALLGVILVSAFQRLLLYEAAYGFTRSRTYGHVFMVWLGVLLVGLVVLELLGRERHFILACLMVAIGFVASLSLLNVDGLIVRQNLAHAGERARTTEEQSTTLDTEYLLTLSTDATPALAAAFRSSNTASDIRTELGFVLACQRENLEERPDWRSYSVSEARARRLLTSLQTELAAFPLAEITDYREILIQVEGEPRSCMVYSEWD